MTLLVELGGGVGLAAFLYVLIIFGVLSHRLGAVLKMPAYYRWFYVGAAFVGLALLAYLIGVSAEGEPAGLPGAVSLWARWLYHLSLALGLTIGLVVAWRYWAWLLRER